MAQVELIMPKMGESIIEATILKWMKNVGDNVELDETILEIATDKVDSEVPSPVSGTIAKILFKEDDVVEVGKVIAIIATEGETVESVPTTSVETTTPVNGSEPVAEVMSSPSTVVSTMTEKVIPQTSNRFYSPLVRNIAKQENISTAELETIPGTGAKGRVTKKDMMAYLSSRTNAPTSKIISTSATSNVSSTSIPTPTVSVNGETEIVEMDRMRRLIADHMVMSKRTSPHVTSFVEADVTNLVNWRNKIKKPFSDKYGEKITFTPIFIDAVVKAIKDFPMVNVSVSDNKIIVKKSINIGMATALPSGNLIVPVIKNASTLNLLGLTKMVNDLAGRARIGKLKPEEVQDGTFTITNVGTFGNVMGTPIINQPQVAIMATGAIRKKPAVLETEHGDVIAIRQMMFLSLSYDHRVVDGFLGGSFLRKVADYLEAFDTTQAV